MILKGENLQEIYKEIREFLSGNQDVESMFESEAIIWVDWREDDEDVVRYVNETLADDSKFDYKTKVGKNGDFHIILSSKFELSDEKSVTIFNPNSRDMTIKKINEFINPKHEIRWFIESLGDDTLGFVVLSSDKWKMLEDEFSKSKVEYYFKPINEDSVMFDLDMDEILALINKRKKDKI